jgi:FkbM family methyltransferase
VPGLAGLPAWLRVARDALRALGWREGLRFLRLRSSGVAAGHTALLHPPDAIHPLAARGGSTDLQVFEQVFVQRNYRCLDGLEKVEVVLDCGANVGYSSAWFLSRWPACRVLAVEPDAENFAALARNLAPYGRRATLLRAGLWSHPTGLAMRDDLYRGGGAWARQVREATPGDASIPAHDVPGLLLAAGAARASLLKIDIEGAEAAVFSGDCGWLERIDNLVIEIHDDSPYGDARGAFLHALAGRGFVLGSAGELTLALRARPGGGGA